MTLNLLLVECLTGSKNILKLLLKGEQITRFGRGLMTQLTGFHNPFRIMERVRIDFQDIIYDWPLKSVKFQKVSIVKSAKCQKVTRLALH